MIGSLPANAGDAVQTWEDPICCETRSWSSTITEAHALQFMLHNKRSHHNEKFSHCNKALPAAIRKDLRAATKTKGSQ